MTVTPESAYTDSSLRAEVKAYDFDDKDLQAYFIWHKNDEKVLEEVKSQQKPESASYSQLGSENFIKGDSVLLEAYISDGRKESKHRKINIPIQNSPPSQPVLIRPKDFTITEKNDIEFEYRSIDKDNDKITYTLYIGDIAEKNTSEEKIRLSLKDGSYKWRIGASDGTKISFSGTYNLKIGKEESKKPRKKGPNKAPVLVKDIEDQNWDVFGFKLNAFELKEHFKDEDNDTLEFGVEGNSNITIFITNDGRVSFLQSSGWYGKENVVFTATDGIAEAKSNVVELDVGKIKVKEKPSCTGPCCGADCGTITKDCPDGSVSSCDRYCVDGVCIPCSPICEDIYNAPSINLPVFAGDIIIDEIPCIDIGMTQKEELVTIEDPGLLKGQIPKGHSIITGPFSLDCDGRTEITANIPSNYEDLSAMRCKKDRCYPTILQHTSELKCGEEIIERTLREDVYLEPEMMPVNIKEQSSGLNENIILQDKKIKIKFNGDLGESRITLRMPNEPVKEASNPTLKIVTTPIILKLEGSSFPDINISLPYFTPEKIAEDSVSFYARKGGEWIRLGGRINKKDKTIEATIKDIKQYADEDDEALITLMGVIVKDAFTSIFRKEYEPLQESKDMIILIHGLASGPSTFKELINDISLINQPYHVYSLEYSSYKPVEETSRELREHIELNSKEYDNIYIIAHSLGSLIAQKSLYDAYSENKKEKTRYSFINKVRKVILASSIGKGSPVVEFYYELFDYLVNEDSPFTLYELNSAVIKDLTRGMIVPRVPEAEYYAIAGTRTYPFFERLSKITGDFFNNQPNDGVVTVKNAQLIGNSYLDKLCENYWEFDVTHTEIIDYEAARKVMLGIIAEDRFGGQEAAFMGNNQYIELEIEDCSKDDSFIITGKKVKPPPAHRMFCGRCGDGHCSREERIFSCPLDCIEMSKINFSIYPIMMILGSVFVLLLIFFLLKEIIKIKKGHTMLPIKEEGKEEKIEISDLEIDLKKTKKREMGKAKKEEKAKREGKGRERKNKKEIKKRARIEERKKGLKEEKIRKKVQNKKKGKNKTEEKDEKEEEIPELTEEEQEKAEEKTEEQKEHPEEEPEEWGSDKEEERQEKPEESDEGGKREDKKEEGKANKKAKDVKGGENEFTFVGFKG
ncbi:hypothetical protein KY366_02245 [Candidatus Woesearchaeota archaeon]|nr:hypothetical protein [Candidatus Woesearchaeota archaeon]